MTSDVRHGLSRVAMVSLHTSPLERPGMGDAGGLNVYVAETATRLARRGVEVDVFTRAVLDTQPSALQLAPGVTVHHLVAGPTAPLPKGDLPRHLTAFATQLAAHLDVAGGYDVVHSHYWLSGIAALHARAAQTSRAGLVHTMHTMARVKNLALAPGEAREPALREEGEERVVAAADALVANTDLEARQLIDLYAAAPQLVQVVHPGVALETFRPGPQDAARRAVGLPSDALVLLFVGRIQPLKAPDVLVRAAGELLRRAPGLRDRLVVAILGGLSGAGLDRPGSLQEVVAEEGLQEVVRFGPRVSRAELADWYRAADLLAVPSHNESFGLVAIEALACGTPVVAAKVGGLPVAVGEAGVLVDGHDPATWAEALGDALTRLSEPGGRAAWSDQAVAHAQHFSWERTIDRLLEVYAFAADHSRHQGQVAAPDVTCATVTS
ncbi:MAG: D-inositol-3-phosphate glycosyltransferase [Ornithinimicrobium sp.]|uniref:D-inositol-3-phosphate glycosyltransferase n=1 Tax=Ornithinimicrobium sp. TaxID=1977084 RepID=UPI0026E08CA5|nr:D-inositol-3-phosphate glycosyltransferase [Ornithinimicrobium sp.]MDO5740695.1 D-inositol-3-phosphate glycosyltransferase [Ornithinimicrobium sp.]